MNVFLQVCLVLMVYGLSCLAENINTTNKVDDTHDATSTEAVTSQQIFTGSTTTSLPTSTALLPDPKVTSTPSVRNDVTTFPAKISGESTTQDIITNPTEGDLTQADHDISTTPANGPSVDASSSSSSPCTDCSTPEVSQKHTTEKSVHDTVKQTTDSHKTSGVQLTSTGSDRSTPTSVQTSETQGYVSSSRDTSQIPTITTTQTLDNSDTTVPSHSKTSSYNDKFVSTSSHSPGDTSKMPTSSSIGGPAQHPKTNAGPQPPPVHVSVLGVLAGVVCALVIVLAILVIYRRVRDSGKKKILLNKDANRLDMLILRRFTINDVKASLGGIPANGDIWHEMNKDSSIVV